MDGSYDKTLDFAFETSEQISDSAEASRFPDQGIYRRAGKRKLDLLIVLASAWLTVPLILIFAAIAARDGHRPFFGHNRVGRNGQEFRCWKIRTMVPNAEAKLAAYLDADPEARVEWNATRKLKNDPRIIRFGQFIRKTSLDELPQLLNVLLGQMSIVGPRPVVRDELSLYGADRTSYLALRPGITGLWQVSGRNNATYEERVGFDVEYRNTISLIQDLKIIIRTLRVVMVRNGY